MSYNISIKLCRLPLFSYFKPTAFIKTAIPLLSSCSKHSSTQQFSSYNLKPQLRFVQSCNNENFHITSSQLINSSIYTTFFKIARRSLASVSNKELDDIKKMARGTKISMKKKDFTVSWRSVLLTLGICTAGLLFMMYLRKEKELVREKERTKSLGKASLGGPWELINTSGELTKSSDFRGQWVLIYFGFTHCPDVCPEEIEKIVKVVDELEIDPQVTKVQPLFITVDPTRDDIKAVAKYIKEFSAKIIGFSGSAEQIRQATRAYRVYYSEGPKDEDADYIVDHTIISYLVNPSEEFCDYYGQNKNADEMIDSIKMHMVMYDAAKKKG